MPIFHFKRTIFSFFQLGVFEYRHTQILVNTAKINFLETGGVILFVSRITCVKIERVEITRPWQAILTGRQ
jgi:hypothetical protein